MYPWHHIHATVEDREAAALWHEKFTKADRKKPSPRSENLYFGPNLLQFQTDAVAREPKQSAIESIGLDTDNLSEMLSNWTSAKGTVLSRTDELALALDPWAVPFELVAADAIGQTHLNISSADPESLLGWYEKNLGGEKCGCDWDTARSGLKFDTITLYFQQPDSDRQKLSWGPIDHIGWLTDDLDGCYERLTANEVKFTVKPREFGIVRLAFIVDPGGILIELVEPPEGMNIKPDN